MFVPRLESKPRRGALARVVSEFLTQINQRDYYVISCSTLTLLCSSSCDGMGAGSTTTQHPRYHMVNPFGSPCILGASMQSHGASWDVHPQTYPPILFCKVHAPGAAVQYHLRAQFVVDRALQGRVGWGFGGWVVVMVAIAVVVAVTAAVASGGGDGGGSG